MTVRIASVLIAVAAGFNELRRFADESGASLVEYAIVVLIVSIVTLVALTMLGQNASGSLGSAAAAITP
jgi:Flp pilus assembly pilin Flp